MATEQGVYAAERLDGDTKVLCTKCHGFYSHTVFFRHKIECGDDSALIPHSVDLADAC